MGKKEIHILVTDDEKSIRSSLREILEFEDYTVYEAETGSRALKVLEEKKIHLVLLDIEMHGWRY